MPGRLAAAASAEGVLTNGGGEDGRGVLRDGGQGHSLSAELGAGVGRGPGVGGDLLELELHGGSSVNNTALRLVLSTKQINFISDQ